MRGWLVVAAVTVGVPAHAETPAERAAKLFEQGRDLAAHNDYQHAFEVFTKSYELDRAVGTELNLADCLDHLNQPLKALELYEDAAKQLDAIGKAPQAKFARERASALEARIGTVVVQLQSQLPGTAITIGGQPVAAAPTIRQRREPGPVEVRVTAPGATPFTRTITTIAGASETVTVSLAAAQISGSGTRDPQRVWIAIGLGGAGVITLAASAITIVVAHHEYTNTLGDSSFCTDGRCTTAGLDKIDHAQHIADISTGVFIGGLALVAAGAVVWYTAPHEHVTVAPTATATSAGVTVLGRF